MPSVRQSIIDNLKDSLEEMREGAGYHYDWKHVYTFPADVSQYPSTLLTDLEETQEDLAYPLVARFLALEIQGAHRVEPTPLDKPDAAARRMIADIERCVMQDPTRGGLAVDTRLVRTEAPLIFEGTVLTFSYIEVKYRTNRKDPNATT